MEIALVVPIARAETDAPLWAREEAAIDFRAEPVRAARCTIAFAACELKHFLQRCLTGARVTIESERPATGLWIELAVVEPAGKSEAFEFEPAENGVTIRGQGRTGVLYGAYELLRLQGWRWYAPGSIGEIAPQPREELALPQARTRVEPSMNLARGFTFEDASRDSAELLLWMARNRLNLSGYRRASGPLGEKLGMRSLVGGHIFEPILNPDRVLPSGRTIWEAHPEWYGLPAEGIRNRDRAMQTQFCVSRPDLIAFLGDEILRLAMGDWKGAERLSVSGFDTWGGRLPLRRLRGNRGRHGSDAPLHVCASPLPGRKAPRGAPGSPLPHVHLGLRGHRQPPGSVRRRAAQPHRSGGHDRLRADHALLRARFCGSRLPRQRAAPRGPGKLVQGQRRPADDGLRILQRLEVRGSAAAFHHPARARPACLLRHGSAGHVVHASPAGQLGSAGADAGALRATELGHPHGYAGFSRRVLPELVRPPCRGHEARL